MKHLDTDTRRLYDGPQLNLCRYWVRGRTADIYTYSRDRPWTLGPLGYSSAMSVTDIASVRTISVRRKEVSALFAFYQSMNRVYVERETDGKIGPRPSLR
jgi:hypothetical protein